MATLELRIEQPEPVLEVKGRSPWRLALRSLTRRRLAMAGAVYIILFYLVGIFAPLLAPYDPNAQNLNHVFAAPSQAHLFGTDRIGRDEFTRAILSTRTTVIVTVATALAGGFILPLLLGMLAGYRGGWVDSLINRMGEALGSLPPLLLLILLASTIRPRMDSFWLNHNAFNWPVIGSSLKAGGADLLLVFTVLSAIGWVGGERLIRSQVLSNRHAVYVEAARASGASTWRIIRSHIFPSISWLVVLGISGSLGAIALSEIELTFFGLGVRPPTASFGDMIFDAAGPRTVAAHPYLLLVPGVIVVLLFLSFIFFGDALNDVLNPRTR